MTFCDSCVWKDRVKQWKTRVRLFKLQINVHYELIVKQNTSINFDLD